MGQLNSSFMQINILHVLARFCYTCFLKIWYWGWKVNFRLLTGEGNIPLVPEHNLCITPQDQQSCDFKSLLTMQTVWPRLSLWHSWFSIWFQWKKNQLSKLIQTEENWFLTCELSVLWHRVLAQTSRAQLHTWWSGRPAAHFLRTFNSPFLFSSTMPVVGIETNAFSIATNSLLLLWTAVRYQAQHISARQPVLLLIRPKGTGQTQCTNSNLKAGGLQHQAVLSSNMKQWRHSQCRLSNFCFCKKEQTGLITDTFHVFDI